MTHRTIWSRVIAASTASIPEFLHPIIASDAGVIAKMGSPNPGPEGRSPRREPALSGIIRAPPRLRVEPLEDPANGQAHPKRNLFAFPAAKQRQVPSATRALAPRQPVQANLDLRLFDGRGDPGN